MTLLFFFSFFALAQEPDLRALSEELQASEAREPKLKPDNQAFYRFWEQPTKAEWAFVYLHGFSASPKESSPLVEQLVDTFKGNAYFVRYKGHGLLGSDGLKNATQADWAAQTKEALAIGRHLGKKLVVIAMSTGASFAIPEMVANPSGIVAALLLSPNLGLSNFASEVLRLPLASIFVSWFLGPYHQWTTKHPEQEKYWTTKYPSTAVVEVVRAAAKARSVDASRINFPVMVAYDPSDSVVSVGKIEQFLEHLGKQARPRKVSGEDSHVIAGKYLSPNNTTRLVVEFSELLKTLP